MPKAFNIFSIIVGFVIVGFGITLSIYPTEYLESFSPGSRILITTLLILYGSFRLIRAVMELKRNK